MCCRKAKGKSNGIGWIKFILPALIFGVWFLVDMFGNVPAYKIPSLKMLYRDLMDFSFNMYKQSPYAGQLIDNVTSSLQRVLVGFIIATVLGIPLGFITGRVTVIKKIIDPTINAIRSIPGVGWLPIAMVWFGVGERLTIFLMSLAAFFPIYLNAQCGAAQVSPMLLRAGKMLGANKMRLFFKVTFPAAFPCVLTGLRMGLGICWAYLVLGEVTGVDKGLGAIMSDARMLGNVSMIIISMIIIAVLGKLTDLILVKVCSIFYPVKKR